MVSSLKEFVVVWERKTHTKIKVIEVVIAKIEIITRYDGWGGHLTRGLARVLTLIIIYE